MHFEFLLQGKGIKRTMEWGNHVCAVPANVGEGGWVELKEKKRIDAGLSGDFVFSFLCFTPDRG